MCPPRLSVGYCLAAVCAACASGSGPGAVAPLRQVTIGQEVSGRLRSSDPRIATDRASHTWFFSGTAGQRVLIEMMSSDIDAHLILQDASGRELARNDDGGEGSNARLRRLLATTGQYRIVANSYRPRRYGAYTLRLTEVGALVPNEVGVRGTIGRGETRAGTLVSGDPTRAASSVQLTLDSRGRVTRSSVTTRQVQYQAWSYDARAGEVTTFDLVSPTLDMLLIIQETDGERLASDDDSGNGRNARLTFTFPYAGRYRIVVSTAGTQHTGSYRLTAGGTPLVK
jgi:hypothetical protein